MKKIILAAMTSIALWRAAIAVIALLGASVALAAAPATTPRSGATYAVSPAAQPFATNADAALREGNYQAALALLQKAVNIAPKDGAVRTMLGRLLLVMHEPALAERQFRQARANGLPEHFVLLSLFDAMLAQHKEQDVLSEFPEPPTKAQGEVAADILEGRAMALSNLGHVAAAAATMDRSLSLHRSVSGLLARAKIAMQQNDRLLATRLTDEAVQLDPKDHHALLAKLLSLVASNDTGGALKLSERILQLFPNDLSTRAIRLDIFLKLKQDAKAKDEVDIILTERPNSAIGLYYKARILAGAKDVVGAWRIAQALPPQFTQADPSVAIEVSQMAIANGHTETGAAILAAALAQSPDRTDLRLRLAAVRMSQNSPEAALSVLLPIKDSSDPRVRTLLAQARKLAQAHQNLSR